MKTNSNRAIEFLLARGNLPILYWLKKDILEVPVDREHKNLKKYANRIRIVDDQKENGAWCRKKYNGPPEWEKTHYIVETLRKSFWLYNYGCSADDEEVKKLVEFLFSTQSKEGDFRGAYLNEYAPTYHALTLDALCLFGYQDDPRTQKAYRWVIRNRQADGGWVIPYRTIKKEELRKRYNFDAQLKLKPVKADTSQPYSHLVTGMVLRALASSPHWRNRKETRRAGELLVARFFKADKYEDRRRPNFWAEITYPFWATDILSSLDSLSRIGFSPELPPVKKALNWLLKRQKAQGYWEAGYNKSTLEDHLWVTLVVLRILKRFDLIDI